MAPRTPEISALRLSNPAQWARQIARAMKKHEGFLGPAAAELDVSRGTLQRWIRTDDRLASLRELVASRGTTSTARQIKDVGKLRLGRPEEWVRLVTRAVRASEGYLDPAAEMLGVSRRTLQRWIHEDERLTDARDRAAAARS